MHRGYRALPLDDSPQPTATMGFVRGLYTWLGVPPERPFDPQARYVTSYVLPPLLLACWRALVALYTIITLIIEYATDGAREFSYFTSLSYWGVWGYHTIAAVHTFSYWFALRRWRLGRATGRAPATSADGSDMTASVDTTAAAEKQQRHSAPRPQSWLSRIFPRPLQFLHVLLYSTIATFPLVVTIVFWVVLSSETTFASVESTWSNISQHALNLFFCGLDVLILSRGAMMPWSHCFLCVVIIAAYLGVAYITYADQGFYTYSFLDQSENGQGIVAAYIVGIGVGVVVSFMIGQLLIFLREFIAAKVQRTGQWGSAKPVGVEDDALFVTHRGPGPEGEGGHRIDAGELQHAQDWRQRWPSPTNAPQSMQFLGNGPGNGVAV